MTPKSKPATQALTSEAPLSTPRSPALGGDGRWKALTARANAAFAAERWGEAEELYLEALDEAEALFCAFREGEPVAGADPPPMLIVATANLSECWLRSGQPKRAGEHLVALCRRLCDVIECEEAAQGVRERCFSHLRPMVLELVDKLERAGFSQEEMVREVERAKAVALRFIDKNSTRN